MHLPLLAIFLCFIVRGPDEPDIAGILGSQYEPIDDVSFQFEGAFYMPDRTDPKGSSNSPSAKLYDQFSGSFSYRKDGATKQETFHHQYPDPTKGQPIVTKKETATLNRERMVYTEQSGRGRAETEEERFVDYFEFGSAGRLFLLRYLKAMARYPKKRVIHEGTAEVDGHSCEVFAFIMGKEFEKSITDANIVQRFQHWIFNGVAIRSKSTRSGFSNGRQDHR